MWDKKISIDKHWVNKETNIPLRVSVEVWI